MVYKYKSKYKFILSILFLFIVLIDCNFAITKITEINFQTPEFIELYSTQKLNITNLFDDAGFNKSNTLELLQNKSSNFYLIVGDDFLESYNISNFNSTIYYTKKSGLGYRNLKNSGEDITLLFNGVSNLTWKKKKDYFFKINESLNFELNNSKEFIHNLTLNYLVNLVNSSNNNETFIENNSRKYFLNISLDKDYIIDKLKFKFETNAKDYIIEYWIEDYFHNILKSKRNTSNINQKIYSPKIKFSSILKINAKLYLNNSLINSNSKTVFYQYIPNENNFSSSPSIEDCEFSIFNLKDYFNKKLEFKFKTNLKDYTIEYWIEDLIGNILKNKKNTTNSNKKTYTPQLKTPNIYVIKAKIYSSSCNLNLSSFAFFYPILNSTSENNTLNLTTKIKILNKFQLINNSNNILDLEVFRGDINKRTIYVYNNNKKLTSFELERFTKIKSKIDLNLHTGKNKITIKGLDLEETFIIWKNKTISINNNYITSILNLNNSKLKPKSNFNILNFSQINQTINFNIISSIKNLTTICYILSKRTKVSNILNLTNLINHLNNSLFSLDINNSILIKNNLNNLNNLTLKLLCKYKKLTNKNYLYKNKIFNYSINLDNIKKVTNLNPILKINVPLLKYKLNLSKINNNKTITIESNQSLELLTKQIKKTNQLSSLRIQKEPTKPKIQETFQDKSLNFKNNSYLIVFAATLLLLFSMIIVW